MSVSLALAQARQAATRVMVDHVVITRVTSGELDPATGIHATTTATVYAGRGRLRAAAASAVTAVSEQAGDARQPVAAPALLIPHGIDGPRVGDTATIRGAGYTIVAVLESTTATANAYRLERIQG